MPKQTDPINLNESKVLNSENERIVETYMKECGVRGCEPNCEITRKSDCLINHCQLYGALKILFENTDCYQIRHHL